MKFEGIIQVNKVIVHILNQKESKHRLNNFEVAINEVLANLIIKHINTSIKHDARMFAKFNSGDTTVRDSCIKILNDSNNFIEESKNISRELYRSMQGTNASPANFLIVQYKHGIENAIALLKVNFNESFYTEEIIENGMPRIILKLNIDGFNKNQNLQKCAFIYDDLLSDINANIVILDKQTQDDVSNYFGNIFLNCNLINDYRKNTKNMIRELTSFINTKYESEPQIQIDKTFQLTDVLNSNTNFDLNKILDRLFDEDEIKVDFKESIKEKEIDYTFIIDKARVEKRLKNRSIITNNGISLKGKASLFNSRDIKIGEKDKDGFVDITINKVKIKDNKF